MKSKWLHEIDGYENCLGYKVYEDGSVASYKKRHGHATIVVEQQQRILKLYRNTKDYLLFDANPKRAIKVHRVVALAFIPNPLNKEQVNHIDGNKRNNHVNNLEWVTNSENQIHANKNDLRASPKGKNNYQFDKEHENCKKVEQYSLNGELLNTFVSFAQAGRSLNKSYTAIAKCANGKQSQAYGFIWKLVN